MKKTAIFNVKGTTTEVLLYDVIGADPWFGGGVDAKSFREQVKGVKTPTINLRINSPGGSVTEASAMLAALDEFKGEIEVDIDGLAASAASVVAMSGDVIRMASNSLLMIHLPHAMVGGTSEDFRRMADLLDSVKGQIADTYARHSTASREQIEEWMVNETWFTPTEAIAAGLAHEATGSVSIAAFAGLEKIAERLGYKNVPKIPAADANEAAWEETNRRKKILAELVG